MRHPTNTQCVRWLSSSRISKELEQGLLSQRSELLENVEQAIQRMKHTTLSRYPETTYLWPGMLAQAREQIDPFLGISSTPDVSLAQLRPEEWDCDSIDGIYDTDIPEIRLNHLLGRVETKQNMFHEYTHHAQMQILKQRKAGVSIFREGHAICTSAYFVKRPNTKEALLFSWLKTTLYCAPSSGELKELTRSVDARFEAEKLEDYTPFSTYTTSPPSHHELGYVLFSLQAKHQGDSIYAEALRDPRAVLRQ